ncbi:MAG: endonuclease/exonuclease/phosphatase family protein [Polyangiales bacterium]
MFRQSLIVLVAALSVAVCAGCEPRCDVQHSGSENPGTERGMRERIDRLASDIAKADADVVVLQEVDQNTDRSGGVDVAAELRNALNARMERDYVAHEYFRVCKLNDGYYGLAVLSRYKIDAVETRSLWNGAGTGKRCGGQVDGEPRGALLVRTGGFEIVDVHLTSGSDDTSISRRRTQANRLRDWLGDREDTVIAGDMNTRGVSSQLTSDLSYEHVAQNGLDHIFIGTSLVAKRTGTVNSSNSDHNLVWAHIDNP